MKTTTTPQDRWSRAAVVRLVTVWMAGFRTVIGSSGSGAARETRVKPVRRGECVFNVRTVARVEIVMAGGFVFLFREGGGRSVHAARTSKGRIRFFLVDKRKKRREKIENKEG